MPNKIPRNAYTNAPEQHPNLILGSLQLLFWLFFRPTAWSNHLKRIDPTLDSNPSLFYVLKPRLIFNLALWQLLIQAYFILPVSANLPLGIVLWILGEPVATMVVRVTASIVFSIILGVMAGLAYGVTVSVTLSVTLGLTLRMAVSLTLGIKGNFVEPPVAGTVEEVAANIVLGVALGVALGVTLGALRKTGEDKVFGLSGGLGLGLTLGIVLFATAGIASGIASGTAGAIAVTTNTWRPVIFIPFVIMWNYLLYIFDLRRNAKSPCLFRFHSAFWDEWQRLHLPNLDKYLLFIIEHNSVEGKVALEYLSTSSQRWAAQSVQIELDARNLQASADVETIRQIYSSLEIGELQSPVNPILSIFSSISEDVDAALNQNSTYNQRLLLKNVADKLNGHLQEFTRSSDKYTVRFRPIVANWRDVITKHIDELVKATELSQEIDSPYITGVPLTLEQAIFTGRTDIATRIEQLLLDRRRPPLLLYGQRRMGKTSLLNNIGKLLPNSIIPMFVDLQGAPSSANNYAGFLYNLARGMTTSAKQQSALTFPKITRETFADDPFTRFDEWLDQVEQVLEQNTALLMLDEFESLDAAISKKRFDEEDVLGMLRHLIQHRPRFKMLLAGSHTIEEYQRWASYLINVQVVHISYLKEEEARQLIEHPVKDFTLRYEPDAVERVLQLTRCHPFLVQLLCGEIIVLKNEQDPSIRRLATLADVEAAIPEALRSGGFFFADIQNNQVDTNGREVLRLIAAQGEGGIASKQTLSQQFPDVWERTIPLLLQRELIEEVADGYRFQVDLIRRWFV